MSKICLKEIHSGAYVLLLLQSYRGSSVYHAWIANRIDCKSKKNLEIFGMKKVIAKTREIQLKDVEQ